MPDLPYTFKHEISPDFRLASGVVQLWLFSLSGLSSREDDLIRLLSADELSTALRLRSPRTRTSFIVRKGILRVLIGKYASIPPDEIQYSQSVNGKPDVISPDKSHPLRFSLSHSGDLMIVAFGRDLRIGVDVEFIEESFPAPEIARKFYSPNEAALIRNATENAIQRAFFTIWVRKEAYLKALGTGLHKPLDSFEVPFDGSTLLSGIPDSRSAVAEYSGIPWLFCDLPVTSGYVGCLVASPPPSAISLFDCSSDEKLCSSLFKR